MSLALTILSSGRIAAGLYLLFFPGLAATGFSLTPSPSSRVLGHLVGARDVALGGLLYAAQRGGESTKKTTSAGELKRVVLASIMTDAAELVTNVICYAGGDLSANGLQMMGGGAALSLGLGIYSYFILG